MFVMYRKHLSKWFVPVITNNSSAEPNLSKSLVNRIRSENRFSCFVVKIYSHEDYFDNVRLNGCSRILLQAEFVVPVKPGIRKDGCFLWIFHGETTREKSTCGGKHPIFMLTAAKSQWLIFKKKVNQRLF